MTDFHETLTAANWIILFLLLFSCFYTGPTFLYSILAPICVIMLMNVLLFIPIIRETQCLMYRQAEFQKKNHSLRRFTTTFSCSVLLGLTWLFGLFTLIEDLRAPFQWMFCIFNTLQGFFLFVNNVIRSDVMKKVWKDWREKRKQKKYISSKTFSGSSTLNSFEISTLRVSSEKYYNVTL